MPDSPVDRIYRDFRALVEEVPDDQPSLRVIAEENFRKTILLAAASYFEWRLRDLLTAFFDRASGGNAPVVTFAMDRLSSRHYHSLFDWPKNNANRFYRCFGESFYRFMNEELSTDSALKRGAEAFMEIGRDRNRLVHGDFASFTLEKTAEDIYSRYTEANEFVEAIPTKLALSSGVTLEE